MTKRSPSDNRILAKHAKHNANGWPACPKCNAPGHTILPIEKSPDAMALINRHAAQVVASKEARRRDEIRERAELARLKAKYE